MEFFFTGLALVNYDYVKRKKNTFAPYLYILSSINMALILPASTQFSKNGLSFCAAGTNG